MSTRQIVLVEDNPADVFLVRMALTENDVIFHMTIFHSGQDAVRALCRPPEIDLTAFVPDAILLDLNTPKSDGFQVLLRLKNTPHLAQVPMAIITSSQAASDKARTESLGAIRFIQKPSQLEDFLTKVGQAVKEMLTGQEMAPAKRPYE
jgi:chemotaxis family two-component system response regulator Rcp1